MCSGSNNDRSIASLTDAVNAFATDEKGYISDQDRQKILLELRKKNRLCFDCSSRNPSWLSITYAIFLCLNCSGKHRQKGVHISFVRSAEMDKFTKEQLIRLILGGNQNATKYFNDYGIDQSGHIDYLSKPAAKYASHLDALVKPYTVTGLLSSNQVEVPISAGEKMKDGDLLDIMDTEQFTPSSPSSCTTTTSMKSSVTVNTKTKISLSSSKSLAVPALSSNTKSNQTSNSFSAGKTFGSRKLDFDFDFNEAALMAAQSNPTCNGSKMTSTEVDKSKPLRVAEAKNALSSSSQSINSCLKVQNPKADMSGRFKNSKSISSDNYFQDDAAISNSSNINNFGSSRSISSDAYFNKNSNTNSFNDNKPIQLEDLKETALNSINSLKATGSDMLLKAKNWLSA